MTDIFISYSRKDIAYARLLHKALKENEFETWIDWQDIPPSTDWLREVYTAIENANTFIFILSGSSTISEICKLEIEHAKKNNKRLIPIVIDEVDPKNVHPVLAAINWIFSRTQDEFQPAIQDLIEAIQTDYDWVKAHTRLQMRALEWERAGNDKSFLLQGTDLDQAENWISVAAEKEPEPTLLQTRYIQSSRQEAVKKQRRLLVAVGAALVVTIVLGVVALINGQRATQSAVSLSTQVVVAQDAEATAEQEAYFRATQQAIAEQQREIAEEQQEIAEEQKEIAEEQKEIAVEQKTIADSRQLAASALNLVKSDLDLALLLSIEGVKKDENYLTRGSLLTTLQEDPNLLRHYHKTLAVRSLVFDPDGDYFISTGDALIRFWDPITGLETGEPLVGHTQNVTKVAIHPDDTLLASVSFDGTLRLWDINKREQIAELLANEDRNYPEDIVFSKDGRLLVCSTSFGDIWFWEVKTLEILTLNSELIKRGPLSNLIISPDSKTIITNSQNLIFDGFGIEFWSLETGEPIGELLVEDAIVDYMRQIELSPDGRILAGVDKNETIYFWDALTFELIASETSPNPNLYTSDIHFDPSSKLLFTVNQERIEYWDAINGSYLGIFKNFYEDPIFPVLSISPDGNFILSGGLEGTIRMWGIYKNRASSDPFFEYSAFGKGLNFSPDGKTLAATAKTNSDSYVLHLWDTGTISHHGTVHLGKTEEINIFQNDFLIFHHDGYIIFAGIGDEIRFYDSQTLKSIGSSIFTGDKSIRDLALSPDGKTLVVTLSSSDSKAQLWDLESRQLIDELKLDPSLFIDINFQSVVFSRDGETLNFGHSFGYITFWNVENKQLIGSPLRNPENSTIEKLIINQEGNLLASLDTSGTIKIWDTSTRYLIGAPITTTHKILEILFNYDASILIGYDNDANIHLWDVNTQQPIGSPIKGANARQLTATFEGYDSYLGLSGHDSSIANMALSPDGTKLVTKDSEGLFRVWDLDIDTWINQACLRAGRNLTKNEWVLYFPFEDYRGTCPQFFSAFDLTNNVPESSTPVNTRIRDIDGMIEVFVPAGEFEMGSLEYNDTQPVHTVFLDDFWIDQTEVSNVQYALCVSAGHCIQPKVNSSFTNSSYYGNPTFNNYPVVNITWQQASDYCKWVGGQLPTEAEWEKAARGSDSRDFPWGNTLPNSTLLNYGRIFGDTTPVGSFPLGASPYGVFDMAGNVSEWVNDWFTHDYYEYSPKKNPTGPESGDFHVSRGGSWGDVEHFFYVWSRWFSFVDFFDFDRGFRCRTTP